MMRHRPEKLRVGMLWPLLAILASCGGHGGGGGGGGGAPPPTYTIGGTVTGLTGTGLTLRNGGDILTITGNGAFTFATALASGAAYAVTVGTQPASPIQSCTVANGSGTTPAVAVTNVTVTCGAVPLTLTNSVPANGATAVARDATFTLTFSAPLSNATATAANVSLQSPAGNQPITLGVSGAQLTVAPAAGARLRNALPYTLTIGTAVRGSAGEVITAPIVVTVTSEDGTWGAETTLTTSAADGFVPKVAADSAGGAVVAWNESATGPWGARADGASAWTAVQALGGTSGGATHDVAVDGSGNAIVVWQQGAAPPFRIWASRFAVGGTWSVPGPIDAGVNAGGPAVAANASGDAIAIWAQNPRLYANRFTPTGGWETAGPVNATDTVNINSRFVGMDAAGDAIAVWDSGLSGQEVVNFARYVAGTGWAPFGQIPTTGAVRAGTPQIAVDATGNAIAVWVQFDGTRWNLWANRFTPAGGWGTAEAIETSTQDATLHALATDALGNAVVVFTLFDGTRYNLWANRYVPGTSWAGAQSLESSDTDVSWAAVAVEPGGNAHVAWLQSGIWRNRFTLGAGWGTATQIVPGSADQPDLAASATGRVYLAYTLPGPTVQKKVRVRQFD
jgi:hypothetical protein